MSKKAIAGIVAAAGILAGLAVVAVKKFAIIGYEDEEDDLA